MILILSKVSKVLYIDECVCIWQHISMELYYPQNKTVNTVKTVKWFNSINVKL